MELTPEERLRIYEEETARAEARARIEGEQRKEQEEARRQATAQRAVYIKTHRKKIIVIGCVSIVVLLCVYSAYYVERYGPDSHYHHGFSFGGIYFLKEDVNNLDCLGLTLAALQHGSPSPNCEVKSLDGDSAMEEAMESSSFSDMGEDERRGFKDGWREQRRKAYAERKKAK